MIEMQKVEIKPPNGKSFYYLIECKKTLSDRMNLRNFQYPTPKILATLFIEDDTLNSTHSSTVENQINTSVSRNREPQDIGLPDTFNLIDSAYSNVKYKKIKDVLIKDIKPKYVTLYKIKSRKNLIHTTKISAKP